MASANNEKMMKIPYFAKGTAAKLDEALTSGRFADLDKALFYFAVDTKQWVLVDVDKTIHRINSYEGSPTPGGEGGVKRVEELPPILEGDVNTLYILGDIIYSFNGLAYVPSYKETEEEIGELPEGVTVIQYVNNVLQEAKDYTDEQNELNILYD